MLYEYVKQKKLVWFLCDSNNAFEALIRVKHALNNEKLRTHLTLQIVVRIKISSDPSVSREYAEIEELRFLSYPQFILLLN
jgi:hypothetical protein